MDKQELTLEELSERSGVEQRTLRSWVSEGLLSPPFKSGRGASYPALNADRALAVRALKDIYGLSLAEIGRRFLLASDEQIQGWAMDAGQAPAPSTSARDYLKMIRSRAQDRSTDPDVDRQSRPLAPVLRARPLLPRAAPPVAGATSDPGRSDSNAEQSRVEALIQTLEGLLSAPAARRSQSVIWTRITITPDLELSVRGELTPSERHLFERLADQLRAILTGRTRHD